MVNLKNLIFLIVPFFIRRAKFLSLEMIEWDVFRACFRLFLFLCSELIIITVNFILKLPLLFGIFNFDELCFSHKEHTLVDAFKGIFYLGDVFVVIVHKLFSVLYTHHYFILHCRELKFVPNGIKISKRDGLSSILCGVLNTPVYL